MLTRREILVNGALLGGGLAALSVAGGIPALAAPPSPSIVARLKALEAENGGRLGVAILDTGSRKLLSYRGSERFPICSTYKILAAACVLARVDRGEETLSRHIAFTRADLVTYSPVTTPRLETGMTLEELCAAATVWSDNCAGNLLLDSFGGPAALTAFLRKSGDPVTRLDRRETELNEALAGDPRDTTSPVAMLHLLQHAVLGTMLTARSRELLTGWMVGCKTGDRKIRAGIPAGWRVADKTGAGEHNVMNDVAVIWPPDRAPLIVTAYYERSPGSEPERSAVLASVGRLAAGV